MAHTLPASNFPFTAESYQSRSFMPTTICLFKNETNFSQVWHSICKIFEFPGLSLCPLSVKFSLFTTLPYINLFGVC